MPYVLVFLGGGLGSLLRFLFSKTCAHIGFSSVNATLISNILACIMVSLVLISRNQSNYNQVINPLLIIGFCGGLSTFSTWSYESVQLLKSEQYFYFTLNLLLSLGLGLIPFLVLFKSKL